MITSSSHRLLNTYVSKPIIIGTYAFAKQASGESGSSSASSPSSFKWTVLIRSGEEESSSDENEHDLSEYIRRVEFNLHSTFAQPRRIVESPPFQVEEQGWGEFEIIARIFFHDTNEKPVDIKHWLKLRPDENDIQASKIDYTQQPLVHEQFEEIVFHSPHEWFYEKLTKPSFHAPLISLETAGAKTPMSRHPLRKWFKSVKEWKQEEEETAKKLIEIDNFTRIQIANHQSQILLVDSDYRSYRDHFYNSRLLQSLQYPTKIHMSSTRCPQCTQKNEEILYLKALLSLETVSDDSMSSNLSKTSNPLEIIAIKQRQALLKKQLLLIRADAQYINRQVQSVLEWLSKVIGIFLACCGRIGETTASNIVENASKMTKHVS